MKINQKFQFVLILCLALSCISQVQAQKIQRISVSSSNEQGNDYSNNADVSETGRYVVFTSHSSNLAGGDLVYKDRLVYIRDIDEQTTSLVSTGLSSGSKLMSSSSAHSVSANGQYVVFNVSRGGIGGGGDVALRNMQESYYRIISNEIAGPSSQYVNSYNPSISSDGRYIAYTSTGNLTNDAKNSGENVYLYDTVMRLTKLVSKPIPGSLAPNLSPRAASSGAMISRNGLFIVYTTTANNIVHNNLDRSGERVVLYDVTNDSTSLVSTQYTPTSPATGRYDSNGASISDDGRFVAYGSKTNFIGGVDKMGVDSYEFYVKDILLGTTKVVSKNYDGLFSPETAKAANRVRSARISGNGRFVVYSSSFGDRVRNDINNVGDVFLYDITHDVTTLEAKTIEGKQLIRDASLGSLNPSISSDGNYIAFSTADGAVDQCDEDANYFSRMGIPANDVFLINTQAVYSEGLGCEICFVMPIKNKSAGSLICL